MERVYDSMDEAFISILDELVQDGRRLDSRDGGCLEIPGYSFRLEDPTANFIFNPIRKMHPSYAAAEFLWYISGESEIDRMLFYAPQYERFVQGTYDDGKHAHGAYGARWFKDLAFLGTAIQHRMFENSSTRTQLTTLLSLLKKKPNTRQAVITMWNAGDLLWSWIGGKNDIPCTLSLQFLLRDNKLNLIVSMRSNDAWLGVPYDVFCFTTLQKLIAESLKIPCGWYQHQAGSMHLYDRNYDKAMKAKNTPEFYTDSLEYEPHNTAKGISPAALKTARLEEYGRKYRVINDEVIDLPWNGTLGQLLIMTAVKWADNRKKVVNMLCNDVMRKYVKEHF